MRQRWPDLKAQSQSDALKAWSGPLDAGSFKLLLGREPIIQGLGTDGMPAERELSVVALFATVAGR